MNRIIALVICSLLLSSIGYGQWVQTNGPFGGSVRALTIDPITSNIYVGLDDGGIYTSTNNGTSWTNLNNGLLNKTVYAIAISESYIYAGTYGEGIYRSNNNGSSWSKVNTGLSYDGKFINSIVIDGSSIFAGTNDGVYLSTDNGSSWTSMMNGIPSNTSYVNTLAINDGNIYAAVNGGGINGGVYLSNNNGHSWVAINNGLTGNSLSVFDIAFSESNIYAATNGGVFTTTNNGSSWTGISTQSSLSIAIDGDDIYAGTIGVGIFKSSNNGGNWNEINNGLSATQIGSIAIHDNKILIGTLDGGVFLSANNGGNWTALNKGLSGAPIYSLALMGNNILAGGTGGVHLSTDNGNSWTAMSNGLLAPYVLAVAVRGSNLFAGTQSEGIFLSADNGLSWVEANNGLLNSDVRSLAVKDDNIFAGTGSGIFLSTDDGDSWVAKNNGISDKYVFSIAISGDNIFAGTTKGVYLSTDDGASWTDVSHELGSNSLVFAISIVDDKIFAGTFGGGIYLSTNNGNSWMQVNSGITKLEIMSLGSSGSEIYAGTLDDGVFKSSNFGNSWASVNSGLRSSRIRSILIDADNLYVGTAGGSVWRRLLSDMSTVEFLNVSTNSLYIDTHSNSTRTFKISSNTDWAIESNETWLSINAPSGSNNATITLTAHANSSNSERVAVVTVSGVGMPSKTIIVTQHAATIDGANFVRITGSPISTDELASNGVAWVDYDGDGDDDLFVAVSSHEAMPSKNVLYNNIGDGTFTKILIGDIVNEEGTTRNTTWGDYNNDGLIDAFITNQLETFLYKNSGGGVYTKQLSIPTTDINFNSDHSGAAWGDYNGDGYMDLFLSSYQLNEDARNVLYLNNKDESFTQMSVDEIVSTRGNSADPAWIDYDNNGALDLFVPNYCSDNYLYANQGNGTFNKVINNVLLFSSCSVGSSWADYDNDGDFDVLIQNNANQNNQFFENNGDGTFTQKTNALTSHTSYSASWGDFDNDGFIDLVQVGSYPERKTYLYKNNGDKTFVDVSDEAGISNINYSLAVAWADYDKDGFLDFFVANAHHDPLSPMDILYHNTPNENGWINIKLKGTNFNSSAIGAVVKIQAGGKWQYRTVQSNTGHNSQNSLNVHFGIGTAEKIDSLMVVWPGNGYQEISNQEKNKFIEITELNFPEAPSMLEIDNEQLHQAKLTWVDNADNETGFRIERSIGDAQNFKLINIVHDGVKTYSDNGLLEGVTYYYRVASTIAGGFSAYSNVSSVLIRKEQLIKFQPIGTKALNSPPFQLSASSTSTLPVSFVVISGKDKVALSGSEITILAMGLSEIGAFQSGNEIYQSSDTVIQQLDVNVVTGMNEGEDTTLAYPNPVEDQLTVPYKHFGDGLFKIIDGKGQTIDEGDLNVSEGVISLRNVEPGVYIIQVGKRRFRVVKR